MNAIPKRHHTLNTLGCRPVQFGFYHTAVFSVVNVAIHYGVAVVLYVRVCRDRGINGFAITEFGRLGFGITALDILNSVLELNSEVEVFIWLYSKILSAVLCAFRGLPSKHHFGIVDEIAVDSKPVVILAKMHPIRLYLNRSVSLLKKDNIRDNFRPCIRLKGIVRQADSTEQVGSLCDILTHFGRLLIHCVARGHERNHAARSNLVESFGEEIIVDGETELVIGTVVHLVLTERHVAYSEVVEVPSVGGLKSCDCNVCLGVKLFCDSSCDAVQFHAVEFAVLHTFGK